MKKYKIKFIKETHLAKLNAVFLPASMLLYYIFLFIIALPFGGIDSSSFYLPLPEGGELCFGLFVVPLIGWISGWIIALTANFSLGWIGGIEIKLEDVTDDDSVSRKIKNRPSSVPETLWGQGLVNEQDTPEQKETPPNP